MTSHASCYTSHHNGGRTDMYTFKTARRVETNSIWANQLDAVLNQDPRPASVNFEGSNKHGDWYSVTLPASVWALAIKSDEGITVGYYHSPAELDDELRKALNANPKKQAG
jgi:hypothetical protein